MCRQRQMVGRDDLYAIQEEHNNLKKELHTLENQMQSYLNEWRLKDK